jgi:hypothetical protein
MSEQVLDHGQVGTAVQHRPREVVTRVVRVQCLGKPGEFRILHLGAPGQLFDDRTHGPRTQAIVLPPSVAE